MSPVQWLQGSAEYGSEWWNGVQWWQWCQMTVKKCSQCGVKKSYAQAEACGKIQHVTNSYVNPRTSLEVKSEKVGDRVSPYETDPREDIKHVEKALAILPESAMFVGIRSSLTNQTEELKRALTRSRPLGNQLDTFKIVVERAMTRRADCALKLEEAQRALQHADTDLHKKTRGTCRARNTCQVHIRFSFTFRQFSHNVVFSRFSCPARPQVRTHNSRILACVCRARYDLCPN